MALTLKQRRRVWLLGGAALALVVASGLVGYAFRNGIQFFRTPTEVQASTPHPGETFRIGGMVEAGSLQRQGTQVLFRVTDGAEAVPVRYDGIPPDLFAENEGVIATGRMVGGVFQASEILAKHDESYMPRELADMGMDR
jgi:cytochrome c-type biogenesis protein CcmE